MADGRTRRSRSRRRRRDHRHRASRRLPALRAHRVLDHWSTIKPVWEVKLEDGTRLTHERRPPLPHGARVEACRELAGAAGTGPPAPHAEQRADGHRRASPIRPRDRRLQARLPLRHDPRRRAPLAAYEYTRPAAAPQRHPPFPARADGLRGARRAQLYLEESASRPHEFAFAAAVGDSPRMRAIRTGARVDVRARSRIDPCPRADERLAQGLPRRHLRRRGLVQRRPADLQHRRRSSSTGPRSRLDMLGFDTVVEDHDRAEQAPGRADPRRAEGAAAVLPH